MTGYVYFIQSGESGPIKIGYTTHPEVRLARLQVANPELLYLRAAILVHDRNVEAFLHRKFAKHRIRGEWFHPHADVVAVIDWHRAEPYLGIRLERVEAVDPELAPDDDDFNLEVLEAREAGA